VLYLLHGCCDSYLSWTRSTDVEDIPELHDALVVMPDGGSVGWYSDWWNHGRGGPPAWTTYHLDELRPLLEREYGAGENRVIAGVSMGGLGALLYAARNPGMFAAAASYSGVVHPLYDGFPRGLMRVTADFGADPLALWGDPDAQRSIWAAHDPYYLASRLRTVPVFLSCGDGGGQDSLEATLNAMNRALAPRLTQAGVRLTTDFYRPGTHSWPYFERELHRSLPFLLSALHS
jgi:S-formylglutathione hydrolase FrmB